MIFIKIKKNSKMILLQLKVEDSHLKDLYQKSIDKLWLDKNNDYKDSGFDLYCPDVVKFEENTTRLVNLKVQAAAYRIEESFENFNPNNYTIVSPVGFGLHVRSSIYKTNFRLANNIGIIDSGYRGNLMAAVDYNEHHMHNDRNPQDTMNVGDRYFQICMGNLEPFGVILVDELTSTDRGSGGFGSTGK